MNKIVIDCISCQEWNRTSNVICYLCDKEYMQHPYCGQSELPESMRSSSYKEYYIHVLCNGKHVKL